MKLTLAFTLFTLALATVLGASLTRRVPARPPRPRDFTNHGHE